MSDLMEQIQVLQNAAANPRERLSHYLAQGKQVVGCFPVYTPEELIHAAGLIPFGLWGAQTQLQKAKSYLPAFACSIMQTTLELGLQGAYRGLSAVVIPALCDTFRCITQDWRYGVKDIPMIPIVYPQNRENSGAAEFLISEYESMLTRLSAITGKSVSEASICRSIDIYNAHNAIMREFAVVANDHLDVITPAVRHDIMKSAFFFEKEEHTALIRELVETLRKRPVYSFTGKKVVLTGIMAEPTALLNILEENQLAVVADDLAQESQQYRTDIPAHGGGGLRRLALQWMNRFGCSVIHEEHLTRGEMLSELCKKHQADGVIACMMKFCDPEEYDYPTYAAYLRAKNIPVLHLEVDLLNTSYEQARTRIQTYQEML